MSHYDNADLIPSWTGPLETINPYTGKATHTEWQTPLPLFQFLNLQGGYRFQVDAAADKSNCLVGGVWYGPGSPFGEDALAVQNWLSPAWCNPPYGKGIEKWLAKFREQQLLGNTVVALLPSRTGTQWWAKGIVPYASIIFLTGRVPFAKEGVSGKKSQPDHESAIVIYNSLPPAAPRWWDWRKDVKGV